MSRSLAGRRPEPASPHAACKGRAPAGPLQAMADASATVRRAGALQEMAGRRDDVTQRTIGSDYKTQLGTVGALNAALGALTPPVAAIGLADFPAAIGASAAMLDRVIAGNTDMLYDTLTRAEVIAFYAAALLTERDTSQPRFDYDSHGDKHFPGGPKGTKFTAGKGTVNPILEGILGAEIGRLRANANGAKTLYYYTGPAIGECPAGHILTIQLDYDPATDTLGYHGYPDRFDGAHSLSRAKGGAAI
jgi:hypothetical protein